MKRDEFIKNLLRVIENKLEKELPEEESEGVYIYETFLKLNRMLKHIQGTKDESTISVL